MARKGRPAHKPTKDSRARVMRLRADGWSKERIARVMSIDPDTLVKHYAGELEHGADIKTDELLAFAEKAAKRGSQASIKWLSERYSAARAGERLEGRAAQPPAEEREAKAPAPGKKQQQQTAAEGVTGKFAPPAPPKSVH